MIYLFAALLVIHAIQAFVGGLRRGDAGEELAVPRLSPLGAFMHVPLFIIAIVYTVQEDVWGRDLVSPLHWIVGLAMGHVLFSISVLLTHKSVSDSWETLKDVSDLVDFLINAPSVISRYVTVAFGEEVIWRMAGQTIAITIFAMFLPMNAAVAAGIGVVAVMFTLAHEKVVRRSWLVGLEFILFSVAIGALYHFTGSIALCMAIHFVRDVEIVYGEYIEKVMEWNDKERAADYVDRRYDFRSAPQS